MRLYHYTTRDRATSIIADGFADSEPVPSLGIHAGVWFTDAQTTSATTQLGGSDDGTFVAVEIPDDTAARFLIAGSPGEAVGGWREFCVAAGVANRLPRFSMTSR